MYENQLLSFAPTTSAVDGCCLQIQCIDHLFSIVCMIRVSLAYGKSSCTLYMCKSIDQDITFSRPKHFSDVVKLAPQARI